MTATSRSRAIAKLALIGTAALATGSFATCAGSAAARPGRAAMRTAEGPQAHASRALKASDTAHLRYTAASGSVLIEQGRATGTLPGSMHVRFSIGATFTGRFTIYAGGGTISGRGSAKPKGAGTYESFSGSLRVSGGTGRYSRARGTARLYGTFNRDSYALVVQTVGTLYY